MSDGAAGEPDMEGGGREHDRFLPVANIRRVFIRPRKPSAATERHVVHLAGSISCAAHVLDGVVVTPCLACRLAFFVTVAL